MLEVRKVSFKAGNKQILKDVSLNLVPGEITAILGPNGAGKSTLLKILSGELSPTQGIVWLNGTSLKTLPSWVRASQMAVLPQHSTLDFPFTVREVVQLGRLPFDDEAFNQTQALVQQAMRATDVQHLASRLYPTLSGGEKQRVHLARVLTQISKRPTSSPCFLLLDEPTSSLDLQHQHLIFEELTRLAQSGVGIFLILHDLNLAAAYATQLILLDKGQIFAMGNPGATLTTTNILRVFGVSVPIIRHSGDLPPVTVPLK